MFMAEFYKQTKLFKIFTVVLFMVCFSGNLLAQMPHDFIYMPKKTICVAAIGSQTQWSEYWEGALLRNNLNMGTHTTQAASVMVAAGITDKINIIANLPYITTKTSAGNLKGQKGVQDLSAWLKYNLLNKKGLSISAVVGGSIPVGNYVPDFLPMSIGLQSKTASGRIIANYQHQSGLYLQGHYSYTLRSQIEIDKDAYQADNKVYNTNKVNVPNANDSRIALGYYKSGKQLEFYSERFECITGDNIRRNDMPFPTNNMQATMVGAYAKYQPQNLGINAKIGYTYKGLNMGKSTLYSLGILYQLKPKKIIAK
jgi:Putative MetA-pathway of phenol degradation